MLVIISNMTSLWDDYYGVVMAPEGTSKSEAEDVVDSLMGEARRIYYEETLKEGETLDTLFVQLITDRGYKFVAYEDLVHTSW